MPQLGICRKTTNLVVFHHDETDHHRRFIVLRVQSKYLILMGQDGKEVRTASHLGRTTGNRTASHPGVEDCDPFQIESLIDRLEKKEQGSCPNQLTHGWICLWLAA